MVTKVDLRCECTCFATISIIFLSAFLGRADHGGRGMGREMPLCQQARRRYLRILGPAVSLVCRVTEPLTVARDFSGKRLGVASQLFQKSSTKFISTSGSWASTLQ